MRLLVDSTFVIDLLRDLGPAAERWARVFEGGDEPFINEIVVCEVRAGLGPGGDALLQRLVEPIEFVQPGLDVAILAGRWRAELRASGRALSVPDALIAATAYSLDAAVLTRNVRDFALTPARLEGY